MSVSQQPRRGLKSFLEEDVVVPRMWWYLGVALMILSALSTTMKILAWTLRQVVRAVS